MAGTKKIKTQGRPEISPKRVTVTLAPQYAGQLEKLASEAEATVSAYCAHILERHALQDVSILSNEVISMRLSEQAERHALRLEQRLGDLMAITALYTIAHRREHLIQEQLTGSTESAKELGDIGWTYAVDILKRRGWTVTPPDAAK